MQRLTRISLIMITLISLPAFAQGRGTAGGGMGYLYFEETFFPVYVNKNDTTSVTDSPGVATETGLGFDGRTTLGYALGGSVLIGFTYDTYRLTTKRPNVVGGDTGLEETTSRSEYGPTLGFLNGGFRLLGTLFVGGVNQVDTRNFDDTGDTGDVTIKNTGLTGFQVTTGYSFRVWSSFEIGPTLVYRSVNFKSQSKTNRLNSSEDYQGTPLFSKATNSTLSAMLSLIARF